MASLGVESVVLQALSSIIAAGVAYSFGLTALLALPKLPGGLGFLCIGLDVPSEGSG